MDISAILNIPIVQAFGVILLWALAERAGIPVSKTVGNQLSRNSKEIKRSEDGTPDWAIRLTAHYNEETTVLLTQVRDKLSDVHDCLKKANVKLDNVHEYGVKLRKE